ncbi:MAG: hypothetical protein V1803_00300 [Candidatus Roizmanbacteria bacterium]
MDEFFKIISKGVIIVPIIIIVLSLLMKFNQNQPRYSTNIISPTIIITPSPTVTKKINIDLNGPLVCRYKNNNQEYYLFIKNKKISLEIKTDGQTKKYDLSQYSGLFGNLINLDINQLESLSKSYLPKGVDLKSLLNSCKKEEFD